MKPRSILLLRVSMGLLMVLWGLDKLVNVEHAQRVAETFYFGIGTGATLLAAFGVGQVILGLVIILGWMRRYAYPVLTGITALTAIGVWRSILDPWGWVLEGSNVLFYPSLIILAAALVQWSFTEDDKLSMDAKRGA